MAVVPSTDNFTVLILIKLFALVVSISMLAVALSLPFSLSLGKSEVGGKHGKHKDSQRARQYPYYRFHSPIQSEGALSE